MDVKCDNVLFLTGGSKKVGDLALADFGIGHEVPRDGQDATGSFVLNQDNVAVEMQTLEDDTKSALHRELQGDGFKGLKRHVVEGLEEALTEKMIFMLTNYHVDESIDMCE